MTTTLTEVSLLKEVEEIIAKAIKKAGVRKEKDICRFLPVAEGYMHHFTLKKMKSKQPKELIAMIEKYILQVDRPVNLPPKQRAARGSRKQRNPLAFTRAQLERLLSAARMTGDKEMIALLKPQKSLATSKRELIASIKAGKVEQELWNVYVEALNLMMQN